MLIDFPVVDMHSQSKQHFVETPMGIFPFALIDERPLSDQSIFDRACHRFGEFIDWCIETRGGLSIFTTSVLVPAQIKCPHAKKSIKQIQAAASNYSFTLEHFCVPIHGKDQSIHGVIYYPPNWDTNDHSHCILYNNGNSSTIASFFENGKLGWAPASFLNWDRCPIIMYDYRGTGLSSENKVCNLFTLRPSPQSIIADGIAALQFAIEHFQTITIVGSSLGGAVATASLAECLKNHPNLIQNRVRLISLDSFTTTSSVIMPHWPIFSSWLGWILGAYVNAIIPMQIVLDHKVPVTVLFHEKDPIIPKGARMAEWIQKSYKNFFNVTIISSPENIHGNLTQDMIPYLKK